MKPDQSPVAPPADSGPGPRRSERGVSEAGSQDAGQRALHVRLHNYDGPLDALLDLIKRQKLNILDIPVARITDQYLASLRATEKLDFEIGAEFVMMAATLIHIKSKTLLPVAPTVDDKPPEDPRADLVERLLEREKFMRAAQMLREKRVVEENVWTAGANDRIEESEEEPAGLDVSLFDLVQTFGDVLDRLKNEPVVEVGQEAVSVASRVEFLKQLLLSHESPLSIREVLRRQRTPRALVATFLALLEMVKGRAIRLRQERVFGEIVIERHEEFDQAFGEGALFLVSDAEMEYSH